MKFGDIVVNEWAGSMNPNKVLVYIRIVGRLVHCLAIGGETVYFNNDQHLSLHKVGELDYSGWMKALEQEQLKDSK